MPQYSATVRNAKLDSIEATIGASPTLRIFSGAAPANPAAADTGTLLCTITLPADWMAAASAGSKALAGSWSGTASAGSAATPTHYRINQGATCHMQGTCGIGSGELQVNGTITSGQTVQVTAFTINENNP